MSRLNSDGIYVHSVPHFPTMWGFGKQLAGLGQGFMALLSNGAVTPNANLCCNATFRQKYRDGDFLNLSLSSKSLPSTILSLHIYSPLARLPIFQTSCSPPVCGDMSHIFASSVPTDGFPLYSTPSFPTIKSLPPFLLLFKALPYPGIITRQFLLY